MTDRLLHIKSVPKDETGTPKDRTGTVEIPKELIYTAQHPMALTLYAKLAACAHPETRKIIASRENLARLLGQRTARAADSAVKELVLKGFIETKELWVEVDFEGMTPLNPKESECISVPEKGRASPGKLFTILK